MDGAHQEHLDRILENRRRRKQGGAGRSVSRQAAPAQPEPSQVPAAKHQEVHDRGAAVPPEQSAYSHPREEHSVPAATAAPVSEPQRGPSAALVPGGSIPRYGRPSVALVDFERAEQSAVGAPMNNSVGDVLLQGRGAFQNFRDQPYRNQIPSQANQSRNTARRSPTRSPQRRGVTVVEAKVSQENPFRNQRYDEFVRAPNYGIPKDIRNIDPQPQRNTNGEAEVQESANDSVFDLQACIQDLSVGDWFMKWTRTQEKVHRRYFWVDLERGLLYWAKAANSSIYLSKSLKVEEIAEIRPNCVVDDASGKSLYILLIVCTTRAVQIGTEIRDKFDKWYDTLQKLSETQRNYNNRFYSRYTTAAPKQQRGGGPMVEVEYGTNPTD